LGLIGTIAIGAAALSRATPVGASQRTNELGFLQPGSCYRIAFPIESPPNYKVLELLEGGWIRAELDAGTAKAQRQSMWINSAQIISLREVGCSQ
jgi:hypothetical protein